LVAATKETAASKHPATVGFLLCNSGKLSHGYVSRWGLFGINMERYWNYGIIFSRFCHTSTFGGMWRT